MITNIDTLEQMKLKRKLGIALKNKVKPKNSLLDTHPEMKHDWNASKNIVFAPKRMFFWLDDIKYSTNLKIWWKCKAGHEWYSTPSKNKGCIGCILKKAK